MSVSTHSILDQALKLTSSERSDIAEKLLQSLDSPNTSIDSLWAKESDSRVNQFEKGELKKVSAKKVFEKYDNK